MTDLIIKQHKDTPEEALAKAKARGAWIIDDQQEGSGFSEDMDEGVGCIGGKAGTPEAQMAYDDPRVLDAQKRAEDCGISQEINEHTQKMREENIGSVRKFRFNHQQDYLDWVPGRILHLGVFLGILQGIRPDAFVAEHQIMGLQGLGFVQGGFPVYSGTGVQTTMPEWSQLKIDLHGLPVREKHRGWRTVLLACIKAGFITEQQCDEAFGKPLGPRAKPWNRELWSIRNGKCGECRKDICDCADKYDMLRADNYQYDIPDQVKAGRQQQIVPPSECRIYVP